MAVRAITVAPWATTLAAWTKGPTARDGIHGDYVIPGPLARNARMSFQAAYEGRGA